MKKMTIPNKLYFRIGEVATLLNVKPYVLRYWETEFPDIKPSKSKSGQRLYKRRDVEMLVQIKELLYEERFTINGARKRLKEVGKEQKGQDSLQISLLTGDTAVSPATGSHQPVSSVITAPRSKPEKHSSLQPSRDSSKILMKIKRDLEFVLAALKV